MTTTENIDNLFLSVQQVAARYGVSTDTIWHWKREGDFPAAVRIGPNCTRWRLSDIVEHDSQLRACFVFDVPCLLAA